MALIEALDDTLADAETKILRKTLGDVRVETLVNLLSNRLGEVEAKAHGDTQDQVESKALVDMQADTACGHAWQNIYRHTDVLGEIQFGT